MRLSRILAAALMVSSAATFGQVQEQYEVIPQGVAALRQSASSKTELTMDHSMLVLASKLDSDNEDLLRVIAGISGLSVHRYHFPGPWAYDPQTLRSVKDEYHAGGWKQLVNKHDKDGGPGATDLWVHLQNDAVSNIAILLARADEVTFIEISGSISPLDLSHLGGHFGIPRIEGGVRVPNHDLHR